MSFRSRSGKNKSVTFDENSSEPTDSEFLEQYDKFTQSSWYAIIFVLACLPQYCIELNRIAKTMSLDVEITCLVPHLINKMQWNVTTVKNLTMPDAGRVCSYKDYNYSIFNNMDPEEALEARATVDEKSEAEGKAIVVKKCVKEVTWIDYPFFNHTKNFLFSCYGSQFKQEAKNIRTIFEGVGYIILGTLSDLFGRKRILLISLFITTVGLFLTPLANSFHKLVLAYSIESFGFAGLLLLNYILFLEMCHKSNRALLLLYINISGTLAKFSGYILKSHLYDLARMYYIFSIPSVSLLFYAYFMPESPRWLLSYGKKKKAWDILQLWGHVKIPSNFLPELRVNKFHIICDNFNVLFSMRKYRKTIIIITYLKSLKGIIISDVRRYVKLKELTALSHKFLIFMAEIGSYFCILPPFFLFGQFIALFYMIISGAVCLLISIFIQTGPRWYVLNVLNAQYFYGLDLLITLYSAELLPTGMRGLGMGLICGCGIFFRVLIKTITKLIISQGIAKKTDNIVYFVLQVIGTVSIILLPNLRVGELPDWKRYRNSMHT